MQLPPHRAAERVKRGSDDPYQAVLRALLELPHLAHPLGRGGNRGIERLSTLAKDTWIVGGTATI